MNQVNNKFKIQCSLDYVYETPIPLYRQLPAQYIFISVGLVFNILK